MTWDVVLGVCLFLAVVESPLAVFWLWCWRDARRSEKRVRELQGRTPQ